MLLPLLRYIRHATLAVTTCYAPLRALRHATVRRQPDYRRHPIL